MRSQLCLLKEPDGLLPSFDDRLADLLLPHCSAVHWTQGRDTAIDITVVNLLQAALVRHAAEEGASAVKYAYNLKSRKYADRCAAEGLEFVPIAVDSFGGPRRLMVIWTS
jgi:hypothetical protein